MGDQAESGVWKGSWNGDTRFVFRWNQAPSLLPLVPQGLSNSLEMVICMSFLSCSLSPSAHCGRNLILMGSFIKLIKLLFNENTFLTVHPSKLTPNGYDFLCVKTSGTED